MRDYIFKQTEGNISYGEVPTGRLSLILNTHNEIVQLYLMTVTAGSQI
jgi:hypothetical protein